MAWMTFLQVHDSLVLRNTARKEPLINADYKSLEFVIMADLCLRLFNDDRMAVKVAPNAPDIHAVNAIDTFGVQLGWKHPDGRAIKDIPIAEFKTNTHCIGLRHMIKTVRFGLAYGKRGYGFSTLEGADGKPIGEELATTVVEALLDAESYLRKWEAWCQEYITEHRGIYSLDGRWCDLWEETASDAPDWLKRRALRRALNFPLQATGAGIVGDAMVRVSKCRELRDPACCVERATELLRQHMESATANGVKLLVPLSVSIGTGENYYEA